MSQKGEGVNKAKIRGREGDREPVSTLPPDLAPPQLHQSRLNPNISQESTTEGLGSVLVRMSAGICLV